MQTPPPSNADSDFVSWAYAMQRDFYPDNVMINLRQNPGYYAIAKNLVDGNGIPLNLNNGDRNYNFELCNGNETSFNKFVVLKIAEKNLFTEAYYLQQALYDMYTEFLANGDWHTTMAVINDLYLNSGICNISQNKKNIVNKYLGGYNVPDAQKLQRCQKALSADRPWIDPPTFERSYGSIPATFPQSIGGPYQSVSRMSSGASGSGQQANHDNNQDDGGDENYNPPSHMRNRRGAVSGRSNNNESNEE
jgi:hypothetical protein